MNTAAYHAREIAENGESFVVAEVVESSGSAPRKKGAWMILSPNGEFFGTVGGGTLEAEVQKLCREIWREQGERTVRFCLDREQSGSLDMRCGGDVTVHVAYLDPEKAKKFLRGIRADSTAYLFGGGHVGLALEPVLRYVGFETVVCDDREEYANRERFPKAKAVHVIADYDHAFEGLHTDESSYLVIVTRGHMGDYEVLRSALRQPCAYIGMIGSRKKVAETMALLEREGFPREQLSRVHSPIGLKIGSETPEEIAISICAEMVAVRAGVMK